MTDPLSLSVATAGFLALGIQVTQILVDYYQSYKDRNSDLAGIVDRLEGLQEIFLGLQRTLDGRKFDASERGLIKTIEERFDGCKTLIDKLNRECQKFQEVAPKGFTSKVKLYGHKVAYPFRQDTLLNLEKTISRVTSDLTFALDALQVQLIGTVEDGQESIKASVALIRGTQESQELRKWLKAPDPSSDYHELCKKRRAATGNWLVKGSAFQSWLSKPNHFLWLKGFAGCGKSVLSSTVFQHVFRHRRSNPRIAITLFYFRFNDASKQGTSNLIRCLLQQLCNQSPECQAQLERLRERYISTWPHPSVLLDTLRYMLEWFDDVYVVLDALDETPRGPERDELLDMLSEIREWALPGLHLLVTSRDEPDIRQAMNVSLEDDISMKNSGVDRDIADFIAAELETNGRFRKFATYRDRIEEALTEGAKGV
jgi:ankyrin repeat domain-containing protein 50